MTVRGLIAIVFNDDKHDMSKLCHLDRRLFLETAADQKEQPAVDGVVAAAFSPLDAMVASTGGNVPRAKPLLTLPVRYPSPQTSASCTT